MDRSQSVFRDRVIYTSTLGSPIEDAFYVKLYQFQLLRGVPSSQPTLWGSFYRVPNRCVPNLSPSMDGLMLGYPDHMI